MYEGRSTKDCEFVAASDDGTEVWRGVVVTGKGDSKREEPCEFKIYPSLEIARSVLGEAGAVELLNRQAKTDSYNSLRNELNATQTPTSVIRQVTKALNEGRMTKADAMKLLAEAIGADEGDEAAAG